MIRALVNNLQNIARELTINKLANLDEWRQKGEKVTFMIALILFPVFMPFAIPTYLAENRYGLIAFDLVIMLILLIRLVYKRDSYRLWILIWLILTYITMVTFFITLGPHYARSAWLVFFSVMTALFFGTIAGTVAVFLNMIMLLSLYFFIGSGNTAWASVYADPFAKYLMFVVNSSFIAFLPALMAGFMLNRLNQTHGFQQQAMQDLQRKNKSLNLVEEKLREGEERLKAIFNATPGPVGVYVVNGHPLYLSPAFTEGFGWDLKDVQGRRIPFVPQDL
ncbi:MAG: PAS domain S-box protein, partial [Desulfobacteraceae bacterium]|nr:PAS domain S-box protein [Desulfobacteraceae bacterium]